jgi:hypothetical protein
MPNTPVGIPSTGSIKSAFGDFGYGALGGLIFLIARSLFGGLGVVAAPLIAGSMIKGDRGKIIATVAGFLALAMVALNMSGNGNSGNNEVM